MQIDFAFHSSLGIQAFTSCLQICSRRRERSPMRWPRISKKPVISCEPLETIARISPNRESWTNRRLSTASVSMIPIAQQEHKGPRKNEGQDNSKS